MKKGVGGSTAEGGAERIGKREREKEKEERRKEERGGKLGKSKARIGEIEEVTKKITLNAK